MQDNATPGSPARASGGPPPRGPHVSWRAGAALEGAALAGLLPAFGGGADGDDGQRLRCQAGSDRAAIAARGQPTGFRAFFSFFGIGPRPGPCGADSAGQGPAAGSARALGDRPSPRRRARSWGTRTGAGGDDRIRRPAGPVEGIPVHEPRGWTPHRLGGYGHCGGAKSARCGSYVAAVLVSPCRSTPARDAMDIDGRTHRIGSTVRNVQAGTTIGNKSRP